MAPLVRRSWAPRGHPPQLRYKAGHREKVSVAAALWLPPARDRWGLTYQTIVNGYFNNQAVADFVSDLLNELATPALVIWDGGNMHKGEPIETLRTDAPQRVAFERLPAHASALMPVEQLWTWLKSGRLSNWPPENADALNHAIFRQLNTVREDQDRLRNFVHASDLPLPRTLLF